MNNDTVLVTGAGALLGQGILRALRMSSLPLRIITADPDCRSAGHWLGDCAYRSEMADSEKFIQRLEKIITTENVRLVFVGTDAELEILSVERARLKENFGVDVIVSPQKTIEIANDKWLTAEFLRKNNFLFPRSAPVDDKDALNQLISEKGFPLFVKPRVGARSYGAQVVQNHSELVMAASKLKGLVAQELLPADTGEFTTGCLVEEGKCLSVITMKRDLKDGNTYRAYPCAGYRYNHLLATIAESLGVDGPVNFQFRERDGKPIVFEINPRFSGTTPLRAMIGFNEVEVLINKRLYKKNIKPLKLKDGVMMRAWADVFVPAEQMEKFFYNDVLPYPDAEHYSFRPGTS